LSTPPCGIAAKPPIIYSLSLALGEAHNFYCKDWVLRRRPKPPGN
jgi:hypothetical protein